MDNAIYLVYFVTLCISSDDTRQTLGDLKINIVG